MTQGVAPRCATSVAGAGATPATENTAEALGTSPESTYRAPFREFSVAFESYGCAASNGGGCGGRGDRNRARRARRRTTGVGRQRKGRRSMLASERRG